MIIFVFTGQAPLVLLVALLILMYLTWFDLRQEKDLEFLVKAWWVLLVFLFHVFGYGAFRLWLATRRRNASTSRGPDGGGRP
jgi:predicted CDP-diglyceride synthetase/phosphatidate cytidylyltransferase